MGDGVAAARADAVAAWAGSDTAHAAPTAGGGTTATCAAAGARSLTCRSGAISTWHALSPPV